MSTSTRRWRLADVLPAALILTFGVPGTIGAGRFGPGGESSRPGDGSFGPPDGVFGPGGIALDFRDVDALALGLVALTAVALLWRRRYPMLVLAGVTGAITVYLALGYPYGPIFVTFLLAVYTVARHRPAARSVPAVVVALALLMAHLLVPSATVIGLGPALTWAVVPFAIGAVVRNSAIAADRARADAVRQGVDAERLRVAQEVHDVVGHGLAAIKMQSDVALHLLDRDPDQAVRSLRAISETSGDALQDLRSTLAAVQGDVASRRPGPSLERLEDLRDRMASSGLDVELSAPDPLPRVDPAVEVAAYRVVQESLTNVLKHGPVPTVHVEIEQHGTDLLVRVTNPLHGDTPDDVTPGLGIPGMRERVTTVGGAFRAGPAYGRFEVEAVMPTGGQPE
ncbi:sensor histidine kinase [Georgenia deserti]|uniref:histidine kinase n=1 Tax=Georgenia deserti TaxID=2093781 RepID=A0ABW4LAW9_9MICO